MQLTSYLENGIMTVALTGEIDHHRAKCYIDVIALKIEAYMPHTCVLDFEQVTFMDSSGIAVIINAMRHMSRIQGELFVSGMPAQPMRVFIASGINRLVKCWEAVL